MVIIVTFVFSVTSHPAVTMVTPKAPELFRCAAIWQHLINAYKKHLKFSYKCTYSKPDAIQNSLTFWRRNYFFNFRTPCI